MDSGKLAALKKVDWKPQRSCLTCKFGQFSDDWGICTKMDNAYTHNKHKRTHPLPAHKGAVCDGWVVGEISRRLHEFLNGEVTS